MNWDPSGFRGAHTLRGAVIVLDLGLLLDPAGHAGGEILGVLLDPKTPFMPQQKWVPARLGTASEAYPTTSRGGEHPFRPSPPLARWTELVPPPPLAVVG